MGEPRTRTAGIAPSARPAHAVHAVLTAESRPRSIVVHIVAVSRPGSPTGAGREPRPRDNALLRSHFSFPRESGRHWPAALGPATPNPFLSHSFAFFRKQLLLHSFALNRAGGRVSTRAASAQLPPFSCLSALLSPGCCCIAVLQHAQCRCEKRGLGGGAERRGSSPGPRTAWVGVLALAGLLCCNLALRGAGSVRRP